MYQEIYKKYRPQKWSQVIGQKRQVNSITKAIAENKVPTAYLLLGERGTGKTTISFLIAKSINCEQRQEGDYEPCNECSTCIRITEGQEPGVTYVSAAQFGSVDDMRTLTERATLSTGINRQVFIIDELHNLSQKAYEALLIPLESKSMKSLFIFCSTESEKIPVTISSRCQTRRLSLVSETLLYRYVKAISQHEGFDISDEELKNVAKKGRGSVRDTLSELETAVFSENEEHHETIQELITALEERNLPQAWSYIRTQEENGEDCRLILEELYGTLRDIMLENEGYGNTHIEVDTNKLYGTRGLIKITEIVGKHLSEITWGANSRIVTDMCMADIVSFLTSLDKRSESP